jgi:hypothetical protein
MRKLTEHFSLDELTFSSTAVRLGIDNAPPPSIVPCLETLARGLEQVRTLLGYPLHINSGYRNIVLNRAIGGSKTSAHMEGYAADFTCRQFGPPIEICKTIAASQIEFDQLIEEGAWVHISFAPTKRRKIMSAHFTDGIASYSNGLRA